MYEKVNPKHSDKLADRSAEKILFESEGLSNKKQPGHASHFNIFIQSLLL